MKILFLSLIDFSSLEERSIYTDLLKVFLKNDHQLYLISPVERRKNEETRLISKDGYELLKVRIGNIQKTNLIEKGISTLCLERQIKKEIYSNWRSVVFDLILYPTPPITFVNIVQKLKKKQNAVTYLLLKDIFPQNAVDLGLFHKHGFFHAYFRRKEKKLYESSDYIGCMSKQNVTYLLEHNKNIDFSKVEVCPNCITPEPFLEEPEFKRNQTRKQYGIPLNKTIFLYGGNLGKPQGVDFLIRCLIENAEKQDRFFVICGTGTEYHKLSEYMKKNPKNVLLLQGMPKEQYDELVGCCDIGLIFLDHRFTIPNFPSRLLSYLEYGMPVIASTDVNTDLGRVIESGGFGFWCESVQPDAFTKLADRFCDDKNIISVMGGKAREYLEKNYTAEHAYQIIQRHFMVTQT